MNLQGKRVVVTGGAGFIGSHLAEALRAAGAEVISLDIATGFDIRHSFETTDVVDGADYMFHQAALHWKNCQDDPHHCFDVMVQGTFAVLDAATHAGVERVVMASSAKVYGSPSAYGAFKRAGEELARAFDIPVTVLRYFNVYGPGQKDGVIAKWLQRIAEGQPIVVYGDSTADFIHVDDVVRANLLALDGPSGTYDICTGVETRIADLAAMFSHTTVGAPTTSVASVGNPFAATNMLGFTAEIGLREGLEKMIDSDHQASVVVGRGASAG